MSAVRISDDAAIAEALDQRLEPVVDGARPGPALWRARAAACRPRRTCSKRHRRVVGGGFEPTLVERAGPDRGPQARRARCRLPPSTRSRDSPTSPGSPACRGSCPTRRARTGREHAPCACRSCRDPSFLSSFPLLVTIHRRASCRARRRAGSLRPRACRSSHASIHSGFRRIERRPPMRDVAELPALARGVDGVAAHAGVFGAFLDVQPGLHGRTLHGFRNPDDAPAAATGVRGPAAASVPGRAVRARGPEVGEVEVDRAWSRRPGRARAHAPEDVTRTYVYIDARSGRKLTDAGWGGVRRFGPAGRQSETLVK